MKKEKNNWREIYKQRTKRRKEEKIVDLSVARS
jgi:hypothetical protein